MLSISAAEHLHQEQGKGRHPHAQTFLALCASPGTSGCPEQTTSSVFPHKGHKLGIFSSILEYQDLPRKRSWCSSPSLDHPWGVEALNHALWVIVGALYPWLHNTSSFPLPTIPLPAQMLLCCADMGTQVPSQQPCPVCSHSDSFCHGS